MSSKRLPLWLKLIGPILLITSITLYIFEKQEVGLWICQFLNFIACLTNTILIYKDSGNTKNFKFFLIISLILALYLSFNIILSGVGTKATLKYSRIDTGASSTFSFGVSL